MTDLAFNQYICPDGWDVLAFLDAAAALGARRVAITHTSLDGLAPARLRTELAARGLSVTSLNSAGRFTWTDPQQIRAQADLNARLVEAAAELEAAVLTVITGGIGPLAPDEARRRVADGLPALDERAASAGIRLGLEPIHPTGLLDKGCVNTLAHARGLVQDLRATALLLDLFHSWWDPDLHAALGAGAVRLVQICNVIPGPGGAFRRSPDFADGLLDIAALAARMRDLGYAGPFEFEIFAADHGRSDPRPLMAGARDFARGLPA